MDNVLYFVDIDGKAVHSYDPSNGRHVKVDTPAKAAAVRASISILSSRALVQILLNRTGLRCFHRQDSVETKHGWPKSV